MMWYSHSNLMYFAVHSSLAAVNVGCKQLIDAFFWEVPLVECSHIAQKCLGGYLPLQGIEGWWMGLQGAIYKSLNILFLPQVAHLCSAICVPDSIWVEIEAGTQQNPGPCLTSYPVLSCFRHSFVNHLLRILVSSNIPNELDLRANTLEKSWQIELPGRAHDLLETGGHKCIWLKAI